MKITRDFNIDDPDTGETVFPDIPAEIDCCLDTDGYGEWVTSVTDVHVHGVDLYRSQLSMFRHAAAFIAEQIEQDQSILDALIEDAREAA